MLDLPICLKIHGFYYYFNNNDKDKNKVLLKNECLKSTDIIIAYKYPTKNKNKKWGYIYMKFPSIKFFVNVIMQKIDIQNRRFFAVFYQEKRHLYIDIDYKIHTLKIQSLKSQHKYIINNIFLSIQKKYSIKLNDLIIWSATRQVSNIITKISFHIVCPKIIFNDTNEQFNFINFIRKQLFLKNMINLAESVDRNVYKKDCQLWRLPYCHTANPNSILKIWSNHNFTLIKQIKLNFVCVSCDNIIYLPIEQHLFSNHQKDLNNIICIPSKQNKKNTNNKEIAKYIKKIQINKKKKKIGIKYGIFIK